MCKFAYLIHEWAGAEKNVGISYVIASFYTNLCVRKIMFHGVVSCAKDENLLKKSNSQKSIDGIR